MQTRFDSDVDEENDETWNEVNADQLNEENSVSRIVEEFILKTAEDFYNEVAEIKLRNMKLEECVESMALRNKKIKRSTCEIARKEKF